ncbi:MAG TPA: hypothetical protein VIF09_13995 [Polyangiaceae bacterium]|jgi:hypothetical protein
MPGRSAKDVWAQLVDEAGEEEVELAASMSVADAEAELKALGVDVTAERTKATAFLEALRSGTLEEAGERGQSPLSKEKPFVAVARGASVSAPRREGARRPVAFWLGAAAAAAAGGGILYAALHKAEGPVGPVPPIATSTPPVESVEHDPIAASNLRYSAFRACEAKRWADCLHDLDQARVLDPAGETSDDVKLARKQATEALGEPGPKPGPK